MTNQPATPRVLAVAEPVRVVPRDMRTDDQEFVVDSWRKSWRQAPEVRRDSNTAYHALFEDVVLRRLLGCSRAEVLVAANHDDLDEIVGWVCYTAPAAPAIDPVIHYVYVRHKTRATHQEIRKTGLFSALLGLVGVRERFVYTFRPGARTHKWGPKAANIEQVLLAWAGRVGLKPAYEPILSWLGPRDAGAPAVTATDLENA